MHLTEKLHYLNFQIIISYHIIVFLLLKDENNLFYLVFIRMREETLKCLVHVVEKLDEKHLQDILVRCITKLQNDTENSIRTNATIFLGRIAVKLKEGVRVRVLCVSFAKAMRDGFVHCRAAGLKAAIACLSLLDHSQLTSKLLPQVCSLLLDRSAEVRELSLKLLDLGLAVM